MELPAVCGREMDGEELLSTLRGACFELVGLESLVTGSLPKILLFP
jgi:hypothetical protein